MTSKELEIIKYLIKQNPRGEAQLGRAKRKIAKDLKLKTISNIKLLQYYREALKNKKTKSNLGLERLLRTRDIRTLSGVAPVAVLTKPYPCPGQCAFCPGEKEMPKSYLSNEPAVMRAIGTHFDPYKQVRARIEALTMTGHNTDKIELIIMGGTWSYLPKPYQNRFIQRCFEAMNSDKKKKISRKNLELAMKKNENTKHRCVGLTLETRPDYINRKEIKRMREFGCTKVELGIQAINDEILKLNKRGNTVQQIIDSTTLLKNAGFKIVYHLMPNLPGSSPVKDVKMYKELFSSENFQPDMVKIYPCVVTKDSLIYKWWKQKKFTPYSDKKLFDVLLKLKQATPEYVRIIRLIRDIPAESIEAGSKVSNLRQDLQRELLRLDKNCRCIRCREIKKLDFKVKDIKLNTIEYDASGGKEYFISFDDKKQDKILAFLRLRLTTLSYDATTSNPFPNQVEDRLLKKRGGDDIVSPPWIRRGLGGGLIFPELEGSAIIREVHTYGELAPVNQKGKVQHLGLGKKLIFEAEKIAKKNGYKKIAVISAVGTREYYKKFGYRIEGAYLTKKIV